MHYASVELKANADINLSFSDVRKKKDFVTYTTENSMSENEDDE